MQLKPKSWHVLVLLVAVWLLMALPDATIEDRPYSVWINDRNGEFLANIAMQDDTQYGNGYWPVEKLPRRVVQATLALEDKRFWYHPGVDPIAVARAVWQNIERSAVHEGASTLAMQVVRMQHPRSRNYWSKLREATAAMLLTLRYGRKEILKHYLRLVPFGNQVHGIGFAARWYFDKPVEDLSWAEIALLSAIPQAPSMMNLYHEDGREKATRRGQVILSYLSKRGVLNDNEFHLAAYQLSRLAVRPSPRRSRHNMHAIMHIQQMLRKRDDKPPTILTSTLDSGTQELIENLAQQAIFEWRSNGVGKVAVIVCDRRSMDVLAWLGSQNYFESNGGAIDYTQVYRSPGSTLKPMIYAHALEQGIITPSTVLDDLQYAAPGFRNADYRFLGPMLPRQALANSRNIPAIYLANRIGYRALYDLFRQLQLHDDSSPAVHYGLGMALGAMYTNLNHLTAAYGTLANDGIWRPLHWFMGHQRRKGRRLFKIATARQISLFLSDPLARLPSFPRMGSSEYPFAVAVKTGTSQGFRDAWTMAYSSKYLLGVWVGREDMISMKEMSGAGSAAVLAKKILLNLHDGDDKAGLTDSAFPPPKHYTPVPICIYSGRLADHSCDRRLTEWFAPEQIPELDRSFRTVAVDIRDGRLAEAATPRQFIERRTMIQLPSRYKDWATAQGFAAKLLTGRAADELASEHRADLAQHYTLQDKTAFSIRIHSPYDKEMIIRNPELPDNLNSIALRADVSPEVPQLVWYVDGEPYRTVDAPYTTRWQLAAGKHIIEARLPFRDDVVKKLSITVN